MAYYQDPNAGYGYQQAPATYDPNGQPPPQPYGQPPPQQYGQPPNTGYGQPPPQQYAQPPPQQPQENYGQTEPLVRQESHAAMQIHKEDGLIKRDVFDHKNFDIDTLQDIDGLRDMKYDWQFKGETALACWVMFNAVSTIMMIMTSFQRGVDPRLKAEYGEDNFAVFLGFITYFPLCFFLIAVLLFNNYYSEVTFYMYLKRGCIIDYPPSGTVGWMKSSPVQLVFLVVTLLYMCVAIYAFAKFKAPIGVIFIFFNNVAIGIGVSWWKQQSIEGKFVSISNFIQAFPDRDGEYGNMDEQSLHHAATYLKNVTLTEAEPPSWTGYMRQFYWSNKNYPTWQRIWHHLMLWVIILAMAGACVAYFVILRGLDTKSVWQNEINPCVNVCANTVANISTLTGGRCSSCMCRCLNQLSQRDDDMLKACSDYAYVPICQGTGFDICSNLLDTCKPFFPAK